MCDAGSVQPGDIVLEIGPGEGVLTEAVLARGARVYAIEKDHRLIPTLTETFAPALASRALTLIEEDVLNIDPRALLPESEPYKLIANIPYYITGAIIRQFLTTTKQPQCMVLLVQKEVAERIARSKKESLLSLSIKVYGKPAYIKTVPRGSFTPPPEVDSAVLSISNITRDAFKDAAHEEKFFVLIKAGFAQKRKLLRRNIEEVFGEGTSARMEAAGIALNARAEDLTLEQWLMLAQG